MILRWRDIEEIAVRKVCNLDIGLEIQTTDKKLKSFNLVTMSAKKRFFQLLDIIHKHQNQCFKITDSLDQVKKYDLLNPWLKGEIQN